MTVAAGQALLGGAARDASPAPRVTVLMAVFNGLPHLPEAIDSVLRQTFADFELVIIDDASTDGSSACIRSYRDPRVRLVRNDRNLGQTQSLNRGLALARGEYVARLDQDDACRPERLERQVAFLDRRPDIAVVATWASVVDADGRPVGVYRGVVDDYAALVGALLLGKCPFVHSSVMVRRAALLEAGGYDPEFAHMQDYDLWMRLALRRLGVVLLPEALTVYRLHGRQQHATASLAIEREYQVVHERLIRSLAEGRHARLVGCLLRADETFWDDCRRREDVAAAVEALAVVLAGARDRLRLSAEEIRAITSPLYQRLAGFARIGIARGHTQSVVLFRFVLRSGTAGVWCASALLYPLLFIASPFLSPRLARALGGPSLRNAIKLWYWDRKRPAA